MPKVQDSVGQFKITIPLEIVKAKGWSKGTQLVFSIYPNGDVVLKEV